MEDAVTTGTASGSKNSDVKADHWSSGAAITTEENKRVRLIAAERQEMNGVIPKMQFANEADGDFLYEVEERHSAVQGPKKQKKRKTLFVKCLVVKTSVRKKFDEIGFVPSALSELRGAIHWCDNQCSEHGFRFNQIGAMVTEEGGEAQTSICVSFATMKGQLGKANSQ